VTRALFVSRARFGLARTPSFRDPHW
jgi:hypothetical protein